MSTTARVICWQIAILLTSFVAGTSIADDRSWSFILIAVVAALCSLGAGVEVTVKLSRQRGR